MRKSGWIGAPVMRREDERLLRGVGAFLDDHDSASMLEVAIGRCPFPHARIGNLDIGAAINAPDVAAVLAGAEVIERTEPIPILRPLPGLVRTSYYAMASRIARFEGEPVVAVAARDRYAAEDALERIVIDYEPLPHVVEAEAAIGSGAPVLHPEIGSNLLLDSRIEEGNLDTAQAGADAIVRGRLHIGRVSPVPLEPRGVMARFNHASRTLDVVASSQAPHLLRWQLAQALRMEESDIRVSAGSVGGSFGGKLGAYPEDVIVCLLAIQTGRTVKWVEDRLEHFRSCVHGRESTHEVTLAAAADGSLSALQDSYLIDVGAYNGPFGPTVMTSVMLPGPYRWRNFGARRRVVVTNKVPMGPYRGYGAPESCYVREVMLDRLARRLRIDSAEIRRRNLLRRDEMPYRTLGGVTYDSGDYLRCFEHALRQIGYQDVRRRQQETQSGKRRVGIGLGCYVEFAGYSSELLGWSGVRFGAYESVTVRMDGAGRATVHTGIPGFGQGSETAFAQICANELGLRPEQVSVHCGDTSNSPHSVGAFASRATITGGGAILKATAALRAKILRIAAEHLRMSPEALELAEGTVRSRKDPKARIPLAVVCDQALLGHRLPSGDDPGLEATAYWDQPGSAFGFGTAAAVVEVDASTGEFEIERYLVAHDCGVQLNPMLVEGQVRGGVTQGLGAALLEALHYDPETGQLVNGSMVDYLIPTSADLPQVEVVHDESPSPITPFGIKGVGENGAIGAAAAVTNAVCDALAPFGVELGSIPVTPEAVWRALWRKTSGNG